MNIRELSDITQSNIVATRYHSQGSRWSAKLEGAEIKDKSMLVGAYGDGDSPAEAIADYADQIRGKTLVFGSYTDNRKEFCVPNTLEREES